MFCISAEGPILETSNRIFQQMSLFQLIFPVTERSSEAIHICTYKGHGSVFYLQDSVCEQPIFCVKFYIMTSPNVMVVTLQL